MDSKKELTNRILDTINSPEDVKRLTMPQLLQLAEEIRQFLIEVISRTGGHLAPNLGVVELTLALHRIFSTPQDKIIFDVGHQAYIHKIITGRREQFPTLRQYGGLSGFPKRSESEHDAFGTGHSSTSISAAVGMAAARDLQGKDYNVVAVIGDGSMTGGMAYEALNNAGMLHKKLIVVLNDNEMSISKNVGAISDYLYHLRTGETYNKIKNDIEGWLKNMEFGTDVLKAIRRLKGSVKYLIVPQSIFEELGFTYLGPVDGHDLPGLLEVLQAATKVDGPVLVHVLTKKGKGYKPAEDCPNKFHGTGPFEIATGKKITKPGAPVTYTEVFGETLSRLADTDEKIVGITAAMPDGTGLNIFAKEHPERFFDVGIAEQHAVTAAAGMAAAGMKPVTAIYSTFMQRAYDSVLHDICMQKLHVTICLDRAGLVGDDGYTHHGVFDFAYLRSIPNMTVMAPKDENELRQMLKTALDFDGPVSVRYPRGSGVGVDISGPVASLPIGKAEVLREGRDVCFWAIGSMVQSALEAADILAQQGVSAGVVNMRFAKPLDRELLLEHARRYGRLVTLEEGVLAGGVGSAVLETLNGAGLLEQCRVLTLGIPDKFVPHGDKKLLLRDIKLDVPSIVSRTADLVKGE
ncbi:MAG: 1-deoxy-D-xylulose-5-phosphate synthase [Phascolarctobacterium sp.]|uniref:1-deoxy-D-xylulose-5-phosphate synthase n=1 Tax=Phascolarctobacterium sp. TaxID=2049039 RepID=UPI0026DB5675|nr:1-deoxy-D-xylulose-5-phosphate synthase [Phascolarctobacterium sp.]MDO4921107.1 1-deoxy-D-xylulose-5-phosphate synthase [Phascolarctobacterium sp.]